MNVTKKIETSMPLPGVVVSIERTEWTPERPLDDKAHLPSTWKQPLGKELTDRAILQRAEEGWYGKEWQNRALARRKLRSVTASGMAIKCPCGTEVAVRYYRFSYLPTPGYYCPKCRESYRAEADRERSERAQWKELFLKEFV